MRKDGVTRRKSSTLVGLVLGSMVPLWSRIRELTEMVLRANNKCLSSSDIFNLGALMFKNWQILGLFLVFVSSHGGAAQSAINVNAVRFPVTKKVLENGLTVLVLQDRSLPLVSYHTWFRVGSRDEEPGFTGIAHLFEHMMFKGTSKYSGSDFDHILQSNGISNNAFTTHDYTGYYEDLPSSKLRLIMDIESDRMQNLKLNSENLASEREVVKEERRMRVDNSVGGALNETMWATSYKVHPYRWPVIGWMADIDAITLEKCKDFYRRFYNVSNAVLVIVGDVDPGQVLVWVDEFYGPIKRVQTDRRAIPAEPPQSEDRHAIVEKAVQTEYLNLSYHIGKVGEPDSYVLDLLANALARGESSRLYQRLIYQAQLATDVDVSAYTPMDPGLFEVLAQLKPGRKTEEALKLVDDELGRILRDGMTPTELQKTKNQMMKNWVDSVKTIHGKAQNLALYETTTGNYQNLFEDLNRYQSIQISDVKRVGEKYLKLKRSVVTVKSKKGSGK